jgi:hypothetical protein
MLRPIEPIVDPGAAFPCLSCRNLRPRRLGEWTSTSAVTFIVTLAASRSVTLAAREAGMSRKAAYALRGRDPAFAAAWAAALAARSAPRRQGDKVEEVDDPPVSPSHGDTSRSRLGRKQRFVRLLAVLRESPPLAPCVGAQ